MGSIFNVTAEVNPVTSQSSKKSPCKIRYCQAENKEQDGKVLQNFCQIHVCSDYCMRDKNYLKSEENAENITITQVRKLCYLSLNTLFIHIKKNSL